ncbi:hypothetical protein CAEBREN_28361 [Caenorhabditis brenneri]|uniref:Receptor L-domain domain-containing protein n=1 Tax=Caenorhabditis brenneri TaxID=135651 RepID=G0P0G2_CAEBE|nr:hypothetical protein CAEBREN_28361 [Caenorhabditis brenneri]
MEIWRSNLRNLSFLGNLKTIDMSSSSEDRIIYIAENLQLKNLGLNSLKNLIPNKEGLWVVLAKNHPNFCISLYELQLFIDNGVYLSTDLKPKICNDWNLDDGKKICKFLNLEAIDTDCQYLVGNVTVNSKNEDLVWKLENISRIYGSIAVLSTKELLDLSFFANLEQVANTDYGGFFLKELEITATFRFQHPSYSNQVQQKTQNYFNAQYEAIVSILQRSDHSDQEQ